MVFNHYIRVYGLQSVYSGVMCMCELAGGGVVSGRGDNLKLFFALDHLGIGFKFCV